MFGSLLSGGLVSKLCLYTGSQNSDSMDMSDAPEGSEALRKVVKVMYRGFNLTAWCLKLHRGIALEQLVKMGLPLTGNMDSLGNSALHYCAIYGDENIVRFVVEKLKSSDELELEKLNIAGYTPAMEGARAGDESNFHATKQLIKQGANARTALKGKFYGWILALARSRAEKQRSPVPDGDSILFSFEPDPEPDIEILYSLFKARK